MFGMHGSSPALMLPYPPLNYSRQLRGMRFCSPGGCRVQNLVPTRPFLGGFCAQDTVHYATLCENITLQIRALPDMSQPICANSEFLHVFGRSFTWNRLQDTYSDR